MTPPVDKKEMISLIRSAFEQGVVFFDAAKIYGPFANEELVGEAPAPIRDQVVITTKYGNCNILDSRPEQIKKVAEASTTLVHRIT